MYCCDTKEVEAILLGRRKLEHVPDMGVEDVQEISKAVRAIRTVGQGNGEFCVPMLNGLFDRIKIVVTSYRKGQKLSA